jgi:hypothetical protein
MQSNLGCHALNPEHEARLAPLTGAARAEYRGRRAAAYAQIAQIEMKIFESDPIRTGLVRLEEEVFGKRRRFEVLSFIRLWEYPLCRYRMSWALGTHRS